MPETDGNTSGSARYVTIGEFKQYCIANDKDHEKIMNALFGPDGTNGLVHTVNEIKMYQKIILGAVLFLEPVILALILRWVGI